MSRLLKAVTQYLETRRALGFKLQRAGRLLPEFVDYLAARRTSVITARAACAWARQPPDGHPAWWAQRLSIVRGFARHIQAEDPRHEVPATDLIPRPVRRAIPVIFSVREVSALLRAARHLRSPLRAATYETLFGLLAVTGMRIGEAIGLERDHVDWDSGLLVIHQSKFGKSREVVLHRSVVRALRRYAETRNTCHPRPGSSHFFLSVAGTPLIYNNAHFMFRELARVAGIRSGRPHDLRHAFAVQTLLRWYREGADVDARMPRLSTYLGHAAPNSTYWYLTAVPELMAIARRRLERAARGAR